MQPTAVGEGSKALEGEWRGEEQVLKLTDTRANVRPVENSLLPTSMTTLSRVRPWDLWMVTAHACLRGSWSREYWPPPEEDQQRRRGVMGMVSLLGDVFLEAVTVSMQELLHIRCVRKPGQAMHVRAASVLPLEPQPVVSSSKDSSVEGFEELHHSMVEEPVGEGWVVDDSLGAGCPGVRVVGADESSQLWPRGANIMLA